MVIRCVVTCRDSSGTPTFFPCSVQCSEGDCEDGEHYEMAKELATDGGYESPGLVYDEFDGPSWLFWKLF